MSPICNDIYHLMSDRRSISFWGMIMRSRTPCRWECRTFVRSRSIRFYPVGMAQVMQMFWEILWCSWGRAYRLARCLGLTFPEESNILMISQIFIFLRSVQFTFRDSREYTNVWNYCMYNYYRTRRCMEL